MSDIFLSYAREDKELAQKLALILQNLGWSVWWDPSIPAGRVWGETIGEEVAKARCVLVLWSRRSVESEWVREEAEEAKQKKKLFPVSIDRVQPPFGFRSIQTADLSGWAGDLAAPGLSRLVDDLAQVLGRPRIAIDHLIRQHLAGTTKQPSASAGTTKQPGAPRADSPLPISSASVPGGAISANTSRETKFASDGEIFHPSKGLMAIGWIIGWSIVGCSSFSPAISGLVAGAIGGFFTLIAVWASKPHLDPIAVLSIPAGWVIGAVAANLIASHVGAAIGLIAGICTGGLFTAAGLRRAQIFFSWVAVAVIGWILRMLIPWGIGHFEIDEGLSGPFAQILSWTIPVYWGWKITAEDVFGKETPFVNSTSAKRD